MTDEIVQEPTGGRGPTVVLDGIGLAFAARIVQAAGQPDQGRVPVGPRPSVENVPGHPARIVAFLAGYPELGGPSESARMPGQGGPERWRKVTSRYRVLVFLLREEVVVDVREEAPDGRDASIMGRPGDCP